MYHKLYKVIEYELVDRYTIWVKFDDGTSQTINFEPVLYGEMWGPLRDMKLFRQVKIDPIAHTLTWPKGCAGQHDDDMTYVLMTESQVRFAMLLILHSILSRRHLYTRWRTMQVEN